MDDQLGSVLIKYEDNDQRRKAEVTYGGKSPDEAQEDMKHQENLALHKRIIEGR